MKKILVCCGTSMITSSVARNKLQTALSKEGMETKFEQCKFTEVPSMIKSFKPDVIVPTGPLDEKVAEGIPVVKGLAFVTGVGEKETIQKILSIIKE